MEKDDIYIPMEKFDFNKSINVTVIFEENEDASSTEVNDCVPGGKLNKLLNMKYILDNNLNWEEHARLNDKQELAKPKYCIEMIASIQEPNISLGSEKVCRKSSSNDVFKVITDPVINNNLVTCDSDMNKENNKIKYCLPSHVPYWDKKPDKYNINYNEKSIQLGTSSNFLTTSDDTNNNICENIKMVYCSNSGGISQEVITTETHNSKEISSYVSQSLTTISNHLVYILNAYNLAVCEHKKNTTVDDQKKVNDRFQRLKNHYFNLSYSLVLTDILPYENNSYFIERFLNNTLAIAETLSKNYSYTDIKTIYRELVEWVKQVKDRSYKLTSGNVFPSTNSVLKEQLNKPIPFINTLLRDKITGHPFAPSYDNISTLTGTLVDKKEILSPPNNILAVQAKEDSNQNKLCQKNKSTVFSFGPPRKKMSITVDPVLLSSQKQQNNVNYIIENYNNQCAQMHILQKNPLRHNFINSIQRSLEGPQNSANGYNQEPTISQSNETVLQQESTSWQPNITMKPNLISMVSTTAQNLPPPYNSKHKVDKQCFYQQNKHNNISTYIRKEQSDLNNQLQSTISSDTDIISPLNLNFIMDKECTSLEEASILSPTPLITHVTSLNPNTSYIDEGTCYVCKKIAKTKCCGCYKYYYCSYKCQMADWKYHQYICSYRS